MASDQQEPRAAPRHTGWRRRLLRPFFDPGRRARRLAAHSLYLAVVERARDPHFYRVWGVPDTPEGRFEVIGLHAFFVLRRLRALGEAGRVLGQELFDTMFADMDRGLRELGVSDLRVGKHVRRYARSFYGRIAALEEALAMAAGAEGGDGTAPVAAVLRRNAYPGAHPPGEEALAAFAAYVLAQERHVARQPADGLLAGRVGLAPAAILQQPASRSGC